MRVRDHQLHPAQPTPRQAAQQVGPERLGFTRADGHAQHFPYPVGVHRHGDYHGHRDDPARLPDLHIGGVDPQVRPVALDRPVQELLHRLVDLGTQPRDLRAADAAHAQRLDQLVDRAGRHALHVGLLDHGGQGLLGRSPRLQKRREVAAGSELGDLQVDAACAGVPQPIAVAVAAVGPLRALDVVAGAAQGLDIQVHQPLGDILDHLPQHVHVRPLLGQFGQCHRCLGHRGAPRRLSLHKLNLTEARDDPRKGPPRRAANRFGLRPPRPAARCGLTPRQGTQAPAARPETSIQTFLHR